VEVIEQRGEVGVVIRLHRRLQPGVLRQAGRGACRQNRRQRGRHHQSFHVMPLELSDDLMPFTGGGKRRDRNL
jgi:hypothetical protein